MSIYDKYKELCDIPGDINEHLPTLFSLASECDTIIEFGVRDAESDYAICAGMKPGAKFVAYDIVECPNAIELEKLCKEEAKNYRFLIGDSRKVDIGSCDMLFIDTYHNAETVLAELINSADKVKKYIVFHDTELFGIKGRQYEPGLLYGMKGYQSLHPHRVTKAVYTNNNGLTIRERI